MRKRVAVVVIGVLTLLGGLSDPPRVSADSIAGNSVTCANAPHIAWSGSVVGYARLVIQFRLTVGAGSAVAGRWEHENGATGPWTYWTVGTYWASTGNTGGANSGLGVNLAPGSSGTARYVVQKTGAYGECFTLTNVVVTRTPYADPGGGGTPGGGGGFATPSPTPTPDPSATPSPTPTPAPTGVGGCTLVEDPDCEAPPGYCWGFGPPSPGGDYPLVPCATPEPTPTPTPASEPDATCHSPTGGMTPATGTVPAQQGDELRITYRVVSGWWTYANTVRATAPGAATNPGGSWSWSAEGYIYPAAGGSTTLTATITNAASIWGVGQTGGELGFECSGNLGTNPPSGTPTHLTYHIFVEYLSGPTLESQPTPTPTPSPTTSPSPTLPAGWPTPSPPPPGSGGGPGEVCAPGSYSEALCSPEPAYSFAPAVPDVEGFEAVFNHAMEKAPFGYAAQVVEAMDAAAAGAAGGAGADCFTLPYWTSEGNMSVEACIPLQDMADDAAWVRGPLLAMLLVGIGVALLRWGSRATGGGD